VIAGACSAGGDDELTASDYDAPGSSAGGTANLGDPGGPQPEPPPEQELEETFRAPVVSGRWVWTANPDTGRVALIDTESLEVTTADVELGPTYLAALPSRSDEESAALVINTGTDRVSVLHANAGVIESVAVDVHHAANSIAVAPSGELAVVWTNALLVESPDPTEGFQDVTLVALGDEPESERLTVGYRPSRVFISADETQVFVVAESTISVIDLADDGALEVREVSLGADPDEAAAARDVTVTPGGDHALVRHEGSAVIDVIDLETREKTLVTLPGPVTDLDLAADASRAFAVVRGQYVPPGSVGAEGGAGGGGGVGGSVGGAGDGGSGEPPAGAGGDGIGGGDAGGADGGGASGVGGGSGVVGGGSGGTSGGEGGSGAVDLPDHSLLVVLPLPDVLSNPNAYQVIDLEQFAGSIALDEDASVGLLYTNAVASDRLTIVDMAGAPSDWALRTVLVKAPIQAVFPAPDGEHAVVFTGQAVGSNLPGGYSVVPLTERLPPNVQVSPGRTARCVLAGPAEVTAAG